MSPERMPKEMRAVCLLGGMVVQTLFAGMVLSSIQGLPGGLVLLLSLVLGFVFSWLGLRSTPELLRLSEWMNGRETRPDRYWEVHDGFMLASTFGGPLFLTFIYVGMVVYGLARRLAL
jgi:hypothetical protein